MGVAPYFGLTGAPRAKKSPFDYHNAGQLSRNFCKMQAL
ncbi:hypothetical protein D1AOALGA4SA_9209 [Olavius algarvensis Delta 1 endosymbiont]|nr:hypothetical protein D1AOALGA4SA_9209 [Olavius algarvensis Delta 1 endosymbiont]